MPDPVLRWRSFTVPKDGHAPDECEDALAGDPAAGRFAIADGASESYACGEWARLLVGAYVRTGAVGDWLAGPRAAWDREVGAQSLSWYAEEKFAIGAHATFLGVTVTAGPGLATWEAVAAGDSCLILANGGSVAAAFPLAHSNEFTSAPTLVPSRGGPPPWRTASGALLPGEAILLATDALAEALLESAEEGAFAGPVVMSLNAAGFGRWVQMARGFGRLRNDDVALGVIELTEPGEQ